METWDGEIRKHFEVQLPTLPCDTALGLHVYVLSESDKPLLRQLVVCDHKGMCAETTMQFCIR